jgi:hypothetical protein
MPTLKPTKPAILRVADRPTLLSRGTPRPGDSIFILAGQMEIGIGNGTTRRFGPGDVVLADDLTGQGHTTRSLGVPRVSATVPVGA